jgi:O-antigen ligase
MVAWRLRLPVLERREALLAVAAMAATAVLALAGVHKLGTEGLLAPVALVALAILLSRPRLAVCLVVALTILCEGPTFGILTFTSQLYTQVYKYITLLDVLVAVAILAVGLDLLRDRRPVQLPRPLRLPLALLGLAMIAGAVTGHANGAGLRFVLASEHVLAYLLLLPIAVANLELDRHQLTRLLAGLAVLAIVKSGLGLIEVAGHYGQAVEGTATLTYYEPAANWLIMIAVLTVVAALLARAKPPLWMSVSSLPLTACLVLSYRRSFWIASILGLALVLILATSPAGRRVLVQAAAAVAVAIWLLGSVNFQSQLPIVKRAASLAPSKLEANLEDRYRLDERANVLGEIRAHPITGLGMTIPWAATVRPLPVEHEEGREYVHFAALWFWLKLGILGLCAYVAVILGSMVLAWQAWRAAREPLLRAFALASLAGIAGLVAIDTTVSDTGVEARFTVLFAAQLGLLALIVRLSREEDRVPEAGLSSPPPSQARP